MNPLTTNDLAHACRVFMTLAYPGGADTVPVSKRPYCEIDAEQPIEDFLPPSACAVTICQDLSKRKGGFTGYEFRLGSASYPHLKLRVQLIELHGKDVWVYSVDTHDTFEHTGCMTPEEAIAWRSLVEGNLRLKKQIESALAEADFITPIRLLCIDLTTPLAIS